MAIVYILTNEGMPGLVMIGHTEQSIEERVRELSRPAGVPSPFRCHYAVEVGGRNTAADIERVLREGLADRREDKEFFRVSPEIPKAFLRIAETMGGKVVVREPDSTGVREERSVEGNRRKGFIFGSVGIRTGVPIFELVSQYGAYAATARHAGRRLLVIEKGSKAIGKWVGKEKRLSTGRERRQRLEKAGVLVRVENDDLLFVRDSEPLKPSAAAAIIRGQSSNGRTEWCVKGSDKTYAEWEAEQSGDEEVAENVQVQAASGHQEFVMEVPVAGVKAWAAQEGNLFVVKKGSTACGEWTGGKYVPNAKTRRKELETRGALVRVGGKLRFTEDCSFSSTSFAGAVIAGRTVNGRVEWCVAKHGKKTWPEKTYGQWCEERLGGR